MRAKCFLYLILHKIQHLMGINGSYFSSPFLNKVALTQMCIEVVKYLNYICISNLDRQLRKILIFITLLGAFVLDTQAQ